MNCQDAYEPFARYYDLYVGDFSADLPLYKSLCNPDHKALEVGCGTGRVLRALLEIGGHVTGVDISDAMLRIAAAKLREPVAQGRLVLKHHDFRLAPLDDRYDRILVTFFTFNYLVTAAEQQQFLRNLHQSLTNCGTLILDLFYPQPLANPATSDQWQETVMQDEGRPIALRQKRRMMGRLEERIQIFTDENRRDEIVTQRRHVSKAEAHTLLAQAGFQDLQVTDDYAAAFRPMKPAETTESSFVCTARKLVLYPAPG
jgi:SAM-dependent methyltransferase